MSVNAQLAQTLSRAWTSAENFVGHWDKHKEVFAKAFQRGVAAISEQEYGALAQRAYGAVNGAEGAHEITLVWEGVSHLVRVVINAAGQIVTFHVSH